jgi:hypothetical protein
MMEMAKQKAQEIQAAYDLIRKRPARYRHLPASVRVAPAGNRPQNAGRRQIADRLLTVN